MNIFLKELKFNRKSLIIWSIFAFLFIAMGMQKYTAIYSTGSEEFIKIMTDLPQSLQAIFGLSKLDVTEIVGYYGMLYLYLILMVSIHAVMIGVNIIGKEEKEKTAEFLMVKPVNRYKILTSKLLASLVNVLVVNLVTFISSLVILYAIEKNFSIYNVVLLELGMLFVQILFLSFGFMVACISKKTNKSGNIAMFTLLITFFLSMVIDIKEELNILSILTPFKYFDAKNIIPNGSLNIYYVIFTILISLIMIVIGYIKYNKRDLNI